MQRSALVNAAGADFKLLGAGSTMLRAASRWSASAPCAPAAARARPTRRVAVLLRQAGLRVAVVRHPMPYGDLREAARAALRHARRSEAARLHDRGDRGVRAAHRERHDRVRRRRLRRHPGRGGARSRRGAVGRRQQRPALLSARPAHRRGRPARVPATSSPTTRAKRTCGWPTWSSSTRSTRPSRPRVERLHANIRAINPEGDGRSRPRRR